MPDPLDFDALNSGADTLRRMLDGITNGTLAASVSVRYRIEGAVIVLDAITSGQPIDTATLTDEPPAS